MIRRSTPAPTELPPTPSSTPSPTSSPKSHLSSPHPTPSSLSRNRPIPRSELLTLIASGRHIVIYNSLILDLTAWADKHPGGKLAVLHFVGRDATDEMDAYHSEEVLSRLGGFKIGLLDVKYHLPILPPIALGLVRDPISSTGWRKEGRVTLGEIALNRQRLGANSNLAGVHPADSDSSAMTPAERLTHETYPTLTPAMLEPPPTTLLPSLEQSRSKSYRHLRTRLLAAGLFTAPATLYGYGPDLLRYTLLAILALGFYARSQGWAGQMCSAVCLGALWHQLTFVVHDAGHTGITGNHQKDRFIGIVLADWVGGLSLGWWKNNHNIHHLVTNHPEHDPDIQHIPFFAITSKFFDGLWSTYHKRVMALDGPSRFFISMQHNLYYIVLAFGRFNLYALSYTFLLAQQSKRTMDRWWALEICGIAFFWTWFGLLLRNLPGGWGMRVGYLLVSHIVTSPVHLQIVLSHFSRSTEDLGFTESFITRQLRTTMDVSVSPHLEFLHGGLNCQVIHHAFPRIPRHNLRAASKLLKEMCKEDGEGLEYAEYTFVEGNKQVLGVLRDVANQLKLLKLVAESDARGELH